MPMSKRLQVLLDEPEIREIQRAARAKRMTVAEWVRGALREARRKEPLGDVADKIAAIRRAVRHQGPTADIGQMLAEIEKGYGSDE
jgi:predicted 2-oxoglutarate/Fe(II)-dependent dioxygenase YbiX